MLELNQFSEVRYDLWRWQLTPVLGAGPPPGAGSSWLRPCGLCMSSKMEATTSVGSVPLFDHLCIGVCVCGVGERSCLVILMLFHWVFISTDEILLSLPASRLSYPSLFVHVRCSSLSVICGPLLDTLHEHTLWFPAHASATLMCFSADLHSFFYTYRYTKDFNWRWLIHSTEFPRWFLSDCISICALHQIFGCTEYAGIFS